MHGPARNPSAIHLDLQHQNADREDASQGTTAQGYADKAIRKASQAANEKINRLTHGSADLQHWP